MVVSFRAREISRGMRKLTRTRMLIIKKKSDEGNSHGYSKRGSTPKIELTRSGKDVLHRVKREGCTENKASPTCSH